MYSFLMLIAIASSIISYHWKSSFSISLQTFSDYDYAKQSWLKRKGMREIVLRGSKAAAKRKVYPYSLRTIFLQMAYDTIDIDRI